MVRQQIVMAQAKGNPINTYHLNHLDKQARKQLNYLKDEEDRIMNALPLSSFGRQRVPKHITAEVVLGQLKKRQVKRTKAEGKQH